MHPLSNLDLYDGIHQIIIGLNRQIDTLFWLFDTDTLEPNHTLFDSEEGFRHFTWIVGALESSIYNELFMLMDSGERTCIYHLIGQLPVLEAKEIKVKIRPHFRQIAKLVATNRKNFTAHRNIYESVKYEIVEFEILKSFIAVLREIDQCYFQPKFMLGS